MAEPVPLSSPHKRHTEPNPSHAKSWNMPPTPPSPTGPPSPVARPQRLAGTGDNSNLTAPSNRRAHGRGRYCQHGMCSETWEQARKACRPSRRSGVTSPREWACCHRDGRPARRRYVTGGGGGHVGREGGLRGGREVKTGEVAGRHRHRWACASTDSGDLDLEGTAGYARWVVEAGCLVLGRGREPGGGGGRVLLTGGGSISLRGPRCLDNGWRESTRPLYILFYFLSELKRSHHETIAARDPPLSWLTAQPSAPPEQKKGRDLV